MQPTVPYIPQTTNGKPAPLPFVLPSRTLVDKGSKKGVLSTFHLEEVRDHLKNVARLQAAEDYSRSLDQLHVSFVGGHMEARFLTPGGVSQDALLFTDTGASNVAREVLPSRFFGGLRDLAHMDEQGQKLATMTWAKFAAKAVEPQMVRTVNMNVDGVIRRVVRSCHSTTYAPYSNLQFVEDILANAGEFANLPVVDWKVTDGLMRLRFTGCNAESVELKKPAPLIEAWNSEIGLRRVGLRGGMFKLVCTNGAGHWDEKQEFNWRHSGQTERIQRGVQGAFENLITSAKGVVNAYQQALSISIDDAYKWMEQELARGEVSQRIQVEAAGGMRDPTTTPGNTLASVIDAVTLIAQKEDLLEQYALEQLASNMLRRGLGQAQGNRILVEA